MRKFLILAALAFAAGCSGSKGGSSSSGGSTTTGTSTSSGSSGSGTTTSGTTTTTSSTTSSSTTSSGSSGTTGTPCTITTVCKAFGDSCAGASDCCQDLTCVDGTCTTAHLPTCGNEGAACGTAADCCGSAAAGTQYACVAAGDGGNVCHFAQLNEACSADVLCSPGLTCTTPGPIPHVTSGSSGSSSSSSSSGSSTSSSGSSSSTSSSGSSGSTTTSSGSSGSTTTSSGSSGSTTTSSGSSGSTTTSSGSSGSTSTSSGSSGSTSSGSSSSGGSSGSTGSATATCQDLGARAGGPSTCTQQSCFAGDACDPSGTSWCSTHGLICDSNTSVCRLPTIGESCTGGCLQKPGTPFAAVCLGGVCSEGCNADTDCTRAEVIDSSNNNPPAISEFCEQSGGVKGCTYVLCYDPAGTYADADAGRLYQPCDNRPDSRCDPQYFASATLELAFCQAVRPGTAATVGQACDPYVSGAYPDLLCGADATCMGGVCEKVCDALTGTASNSLGCPSGQQCISAQGTNLVSRDQVGGCLASDCDPFTTDVAASGCGSFCGGPASVCNWVIGDLPSSQPRGYCEAAPTNPIAVGGDCSGGGVCTQGTYCLNTASGPACVELCDNRAAAGTADACPSGKTCTAFSGFQHAGYCH